MTSALNDLLIFLVLVAAAMLIAWFTGGAAKLGGEEDPRRHR